MPLANDHLHCTARLVLGAALFLSGAATLGGCALTRGPEVEVVNARWEEVTEDAAVAQFDLELVNPNDQPLELRMMHYQFEVDGRESYDGRRAVQVTLAGRSRRTVRIPAVLRFDRLEESSARGSDEPVEYALHGRLVYLVPTPLSETLLDVGIRRPAKRFDDTGRLPPPGE